MNTADWSVDLNPTDDERVTLPHDGYLWLGPREPAGGRDVALCLRPGLSAEVRVARLLEPGTAGEPDQWHEGPDGSRFAWCRPVLLPSLDE